MKRKMVLITQPFIYLVAALLSVPLVLISVFVPVPVHTQADLAQVRLGLPLPFMIQDQTGYTPPLPWQTHFYSPWENPTHILLPELLLSLAIIFVVISLLLNGLTFTLLFALSRCKVLNKSAQTL